MLPRRGSPLERSPRNGSGLAHNVRVLSVISGYKLCATHTRDFYGEMDNALAEGFPRQGVRLTNARNMNSANFRVLTLIFKLDLRFQEMSSRVSERRRCFESYIFYVVGLGLLLAPQRTSCVRPLEDRDWSFESSNIN